MFANWLQVNTLTVDTDTGAPAWDASQFYNIGDLVNYNGAQYRCITSHQANSTWTPSAAHSLWTLI